MLFECVKLRNVPNPMAQVIKGDGEYEIEARVKGYSAIKTKELLMKKKQHIEKYETIITCFDEAIIACFDSSHQTAVQ